MERTLEDYEALILTSADELAHALEELAELTTSDNDHKALMANLALAQVTVTAMAALSNLAIAAAIVNNRSAGSYKGPKAS